jgi:hypothetical protein
MPLTYALVARDTTVLCDHSAFAGNVPYVAKECLQQLQPGEGHSWSADGVGNTADRGRMPSPCLGGKHAQRRCTLSRPTDAASRTALLSCRPGQADHGRGPPHAQLFAARRLHVHGRSR